MSVQSKSRLLLAVLVGALTIGAASPTRAQHQLPTPQVSSQRRPGLGAFFGSGIRWSPQALLALPAPRSVNRLFVGAKQGQRLGVTTGASRHGMSLPVTPHAGYVSTSYTVSLTIDAPDASWVLITSDDDDCNTWCYIADWDSDNGVWRATVGVNPGANTLNIDAWDDCDDSDWECDGPEGSGGGTYYYYSGLGANSLTISPDSTHLYPGETSWPTVLQTDGDGYLVSSPTFASLTSSNTSIATVASYVAVTGVGAGTATITVTANKADHSGTITKTFTRIVDAFPVTFATGDVTAPFHSWADVTFIIHNTSGGPVYAYYPDCSGWSWPGYYSGSPYYDDCTTTSHGSLAAGQTDTTVVHLYIGNQPIGARPVWMRVLDANYHTIYSPPAHVSTYGGYIQPQVRPKPATKTLIPRLAHADTFWVKNVGTTSSYYSYAASCGAFASAGCTVVAPASYTTIAPGDSAPVTVAYTPSTTAGATAAITVSAGRSFTLYGDSTAQADTGVVNATANDTSPPTVTATPAASSVQTTRAITDTITACDNGLLVGSPTVKLNGVVQGDMFLWSTHTGCTTYGSALNAVLLRPGTDTLRVIANDGYNTDTLTRIFSYDEAPEHQPQVAAVLSTSRMTPAITWADSFTVHNPGTLPVVYTFSPSCGGLTCTASPTSATVQPGDTIKVAVGYTSPSSAGVSTTIQLTASITSATSHTLTASASTTAITTAGAMPQITVTPANGTTTTSSNISATITWCDPDDAISTHEVRLGGVLLADTYVSGSHSGCTSAGTSTYTLALQPGSQALVATAVDAAGHIARGGSIIAYLPSVNAFAPWITPKGASVTYPRGSTATQQFLVQNVGSFPASYQLAPDCGTFTVCYADKSAVTLAPGVSDSAMVSFLMPTAIGASTPIKLAATYTGGGRSVTDTGVVVAHTPTIYALYQPQITLAGGSLVEPGAGNAVTALVKNTGTDTVTYDIVVTHGANFVLGGTGGDTTAGLTPGGHVTVAPGATLYFLINAEATGAAGSTGSVTVSARYEAPTGQIADAVATMSMEIMSWEFGVTVAAPDDPPPVVPGTTSANMADFTVSNAGNVLTSFTYTVSCDSLPTSCTPTTGSFELDSAASRVVEVSYYGSSVPYRRGTISLTVNGTGDASDISASATALIHVAGAVASARITPSGIDSVVPHSRSPINFAIENHSDSTDSFHYTVVCSTGAACTSTACPSGASCITTTGFTGETALLAPGERYQFDVSATAGDSGATARTITITATSDQDTTYSLAKTLSLSATVYAEIVVDAASPNPGTSINRGSCVTIAAGDGGAYECGQLRIAQTLSATTTMNVARAPVLLYESGSAGSLRLRLGADVSFAQDVRASSIVGTVSVGGASHSNDPIITSDSVALVRHARLSFAAPTTVATGAYYVHVQVEAKDGGTVVATAQDSTLLAFVNRTTSPFGNGWWLDGLEQLVTNVPSSSTHKLWVGGDGSTRLYTKQTDNVWTVSPSVDRPDTLVQVNDTTWRRHLRSGAYTEFDAAGRHTRTVNAEGFVTRFVYFSSSFALDSIVLPVPSGSSAKRAYTFTYTYDSDSNTTGVFVNAPPVGSTARKDSLKYTAASGGALAKWTMFDALGQPAIVRLDADLRPVKYLNRRGDSTAWSWDPTGFTLSGTSIPLESGGPITMGYCAAEATGLVGCLGGLQPTASAVTSYTDPRGNVTSFTLTRFGAPSQITDALGHATNIQYASDSLPLLATRVEKAGHVVSAIYDPRNGLLQSETDENPLGDGINAITNFAWDTKWDRLNSVVDATNRTTVLINYDTTTGQRLWQQDGRGGTSQVNFTYTGGQLASISTPGNADGATTRIYYDSLGNVDSVMTPLGYRTVTRRDGIGRAVLTLSPAAESPSTAPANRDSVVYDLLDRVTKSLKLGVATGMGYTIAPDTVVVQSTYDAEGNQTEVQRFANNPEVPDADLVTTRTFDEANRMVAEETYGGTQTYAYDLAGNLIAHWTLRDWTVADPAVPIAMTYDALNRLKTRVIAGDTIVMDSTCCLGDTLHLTRRGALVTFPFYNGMSIPKDSAFFDYDDAGNMTVADNQDALIRRAYYPNGLLKSETVRVGADTTHSRDTTSTNYPNAYVTRYHYDLAGRRDTLVLPGLACAASVEDGCRQNYTYDLLSGALKQVTGWTMPAITTPPTFAFTYDVAGRPDSVFAPGSQTTTWHYDADGRRTRRLEAGYLSHDDSLSYDGAGRVLTLGATTVKNTTTYTESATNGYDGLGVLRYSETSRTGAETTQQNWLPDALGNMRRSCSNCETISSAGLADTNHYDAFGRVASTVRTSNLESLPYEINRYAYDAEGNASWVQTVRETADSSTTALVSRSWYGPDGKLRVFEHIGDDDVNTTEWTVQERYWYDALGRRVMLHSDRPFENNCRTYGCRSVLDRYVWDGDQLAMEVRLPVPHNVGHASPNDDLSWQSNATEYRGFAGVVAYLHGPGLDAPLGFYRQADDVDPAFVIPHTTWRGTYDGGTTMSDGVGPDNIDWVGNEQGVYRDVNSGRNVGSIGWGGSLIQGMRDASGLLYMRNRYYDPTNGRFTQEDPMGLGGGLNLYGFAGGDPVNHSDPFGLCPDPKDPKCQDGPVGFVGVQGTLILGHGGTVAAGVFGGEGGAGLYLRVGGGVGADIAGGLEIGASQSLAALRGKGLEGCVGAGGVGGCLSGNSSGLTGSLGPSIGSRDLPIPISMHVGGTYTAAPTFGDIAGAARQGAADVAAPWQELARAVANFLTRPPR